MRRTLSHAPDRVFYGWWIVLIGCIQDAVKGGTFYDQTQSYTYALIGFIMCYAVAGLILWRLPHPKRPTRLAAGA